MRRRPVLTVMLLAIMLLTGMPAAALQPATPSVTEWVSRPLPSPLPVPTGDMDFAAQLLAAHVAPGGEDVVRALLTALTMSGIGVVSMDGTVLIEPPPGGQGIAIDEGDLWSLAEMQGTTTAPLTGFADGLGLSFTAVAGEPDSAIEPEAAAEAIVADIRTLAENEQPASRFFGRFLAGLSLVHRDYAVDLLATDSARDASEIRVSALQMGLISYRIAADLQAEIDSDPAAADLTGAAGFLPLRSVQPSKAPCTMTATEAFIVDQAANVFTTGFGKLLSLMESGGVKWAGTAGTASTIAGMVLAYVKLFTTLALYEVTMEMDPAGPLVRTKGTSIDGEVKRFTATGRFDTGKSQVINCLRLAINLSTGLDISLPQDGPMGGAPVAWGFGDGKATMVGGASAGFLVFYPPNDPSTGQAMSPARMTADENGKSRMTVAGRRQPGPRAVSDAARPVEKRAEVRVAFTPTAPDLANDLVAAIWAAIGLAGGPAALLTLPADLLMRTNLLWERYFPFTVIDWTEDPAYQVTGNISFIHQGCDDPLPDDFITFTGTMDQPGEDGGVTGVAIPSGTIAGVPLRGEFHLVGTVDGDTLNWGIVPEAVMDTLGIWYGFSPYITPRFLGVAPAEGGPGMWVPFLATAGLGDEDCVIAAQVETEFTRLDSPEPPEDDDPGPPIPMV
jgi:hypothetical protein